MPIRRDRSAGQGGATREALVRSGSLIGSIAAGELIGLGQIGYVKAIQVKLDEIGSEYPEHADFVSQMRSFVDRFDLDQYMATLKTLHSYDH